MAAAGNKQHARCAPRLLGAMSLLISVFMITAKQQPRPGVCPTSEKHMGINIGIGRLKVSCTSQPRSELLHCLPHYAC